MELELQNTPHVGSVGYELRVTLVDEDRQPVDISTATDLALALLPPGGTVKVVSAALTGDGSDGQLSYLTIAGDLDEAGTWKVQARVTFPAPSVLFSAVETVTVATPLFP